MHSCAHTLMINRINQLFSNLSLPKAAIVYSHIMIEVVLLFNKLVHKSNKISHHHARLQTRHCSIVRTII